MRAFTISGPGPARSLHLATVDSPTPGRGEVRLRVEAVSLNPVDVKLVASGHPHWRYPHVPGVDAAGTIDAVGEGVEGWRPGDRAAGHLDLRRAGTFAEHVVALAHAIARIPEGVEAESAAALPCAAMTAHQALDRKMRVGPGDILLVHAASGGVGGFAVQLAKLKGARVLATCSERNADYVRSLGADAVIDYRRGHVAEQVLDLTGGLGVTAVLNTVGHASATADLAFLRFNGQLAFIAGAPDPDAHPFAKALSLHAIALGGAYAAGDREQQEDLARMLSELLSLVARGQLSPCVDQVEPFEALPASLERLGAGHGRGKTVCRVAEA